MTKLPETTNKDYIERKICRTKWLSEILKFKAESHFRWKFPITSQQTVNRAQNEGPLLYEAAHTQALNTRFGE
jgi:hypothetical protein